MMSFDHSVPALLLTAYGVVLVVSFVWIRLVFDRPFTELDFAALLDKLEPFWMGNAGVLVAAESHGRGTPQQNLLSRKETLRRISANTRVLILLSQVPQHQASIEERALARQIRWAGLRLRVLALLLRFALPDAWHPLGTGLLLKHTTTSYSSIVLRLLELYRVYRSRQSAALATACNFELGPSVV